MTKKIKQGEEMWKARLMVQGFEERKLMREGIKLCLSVIKKEKWRVRAIDVKTAYLQGKNIERTIVVKPPREAKTGKLLKLRKAVYGLKDTARVW